jgi:AP-1 complex subunit sigma 1/2
VDKDDNELQILEVIHHYVEILDQYFGNVCELDIIFNFNKAYYLLDEILLGGHIQESSKKIIMKSVNNQEILIGDNSDDEKNGF